MANFADLSHHQPSFDVKTYKIHRQTVAFKATEGTGFKDPAFKSRWQAATGLRRVAYHYAKAKFNGADEWRFCWATVRDAGFNPATDVIALDIEDPDSPSRAAANAQEFTKAAVADGVTIGLVYTYPNYAIGQRITANLFPPGWRRLWYADYSSALDANVDLPPGWDKSQYVARQYTDHALVPGVGMCDDNRIQRDWMTPIPTTPEGDSMAGWSDQDSANLATVADWVQRTYRSGFASVNADGSQDPTHVNVSVRGVNEAQDVTNGHLEAIHELLSALVSAVQALAPAAPVSTGTLPPEMDQAPQVPDPSQ